MILQKLEEHPAPSKIIVYAGDVESVRRLSQELGYQAYFNEAGSRKEKTARQTAWMSGDQRVMIATNAFGLGIDAPDVRTVIHVGWIQQLRGYVPESGRAGRDVSFGHFL